MANRDKMAEIFRWIQRPQRIELEKELRAIYRALRDLQAAENDARCIFVSNVHGAPEEVRRHFESCGTVSDVNEADGLGLVPKGCAAVEFLEVGAVEKALLLDESQLNGRQIRVVPKRTRKVKPEFQRPPEKSQTELRQHP